MNSPRKSGGTLRGYYGGLVGYYGSQKIVWVYRQHTSIRVIKPIHLKCNQQALRKSNIPLFASEIGAKIVVWLHYLLIRSRAALTDVGFKVILN